jgi:cytochrome c peroxidase
LWNVAYNRWYFWDGRADSLWAQALEPIESPGELGGSRLQVARRIHDEPWLRRAYEGLYGPVPDLGDLRRFPPRGGPRAHDPALRRAWEAMAPADQRAADEVFVNAARAIAAYERRLVSRRSPFDVFVEGLRAGDEARQRALSATARRGLKVFVGRGECWPCHDGPNFTDGEFHDVGVPSPSGGPPADSGRYAGAKRLGLRGADASTWGQFKTPTLRNVARTAPYMHQGQLQTLGQVVEHYSTLRGATFGAHHREALLRPRQLTPDETAALVAFLESLTDEDIDADLKRPPSSPQ